jgi:hypothetical protein
MHRAGNTLCLRTKTANGSLHPLQGCYERTLFSGSVSLPQEFLHILRVLSFNRQNILHDFAGR